MKRTEKTFNVQLNRWIGLVLAGLALAAGASGATPTDNAGWRRLFDSWKAPCDPVRIAGNLYYVGATGVSSYPGALGKAVTDAEKAVEAELAKERAAGKERTASQQPVSDGLPRKSSAN